MHNEIAKGIRYNKMLNDLWKTLDEPTINSVTESINQLDWDHPLRVMHKDEELKETYEAFCRTRQSGPGDC